MLLLRKKPSQEGVVYQSDLAMSSKRCGFPTRLRGLQPSEKPPESGGFLDKAKELCGPPRPL
jgi:hypothetical protein